MTDREEAVVELERVRRDIIAALALHAMISNVGVPLPAAEMATRAYELADALIAKSGVTLLQA